MNDKSHQPKVDNTTTPPKGKSKYTNSILSDLNKLRDIVYQDAVKHGLWDHNPSNEHFLMQTMLEISEAIQASVSNRHANVTRFKYLSSNISYPRTSWRNSLFESYIKNTVEDELADVVLMLSSFCGYRNIDMNNHHGYQSYARLEYAGLKQQTFEEFCFDICKLITEGCIIEPIYVVMAYCEHNNIDLAWHIEQKMKYNSTRADHNNKKN